MIIPRRKVRPGALAECGKVSAEQGRWVWVPLICRKDGLVLRRKGREEVKSKAWYAIRVEGLHKGIEQRKMETFSLDGRIQNLEMFLKQCPGFVGCL